ncbi:MAG: helix-turn-helix transcriptional regulator [Bacteroidales bacterium]|nr:helix-turn-helix transcriptional regulator [Bacteroidales bacterium]
MIDKISSYKIFFKLIESYGPFGFSGIDSNDPLMAEAERMMKKNDQFIYFGDLILFKILYTSNRSLDMMGVEAGQLTAFNFFQSIHPSEVKRHILGRTALLKIAHDLFTQKKGYKILSTNFRVKNAKGEYTNLLFQYYIYFSHLPYESVFAFKVHTNVDWLVKQNYGYHYYVGDDLSNLRYPDNELLQKGNLFSKREFEIIQLVEQGNNSDQIADKLFLSRHTVDTHRRNILYKAQKLNISAVIHDLKEMGLL